MSKYIVDDIDISDEEDSDEENSDEENFDEKNLKNTCMVKLFLRHIKEADKIYCFFCI